ncbi:hypothetical protein [Sedimentibacter sp. B4]|uniref:hypothetical protein n=1 Tax=Sedimentibacter sp. B4 TaxID=304766 RepID=UPI0002E890F2|nr:hypothetical protein [Sedimentibacter sp. B4]
MNKIELNKYATEIIEKSFKENGFKVEPSNLPIGQVNFIATSNSRNEIKIKVKAITQIGSYIFIRKTNFNINDSNLYMALLYVPDNGGEKLLYLIPAEDWGKDIYPLSGKDYNKKGQVSLPEWGISYSKKAKDALQTYRFSNMIHKIG